MSGKSLLELQMKNENWRFEILDKNGNVVVSDSGYNSSSDAEHAASIMYRELIKSGCHIRTVRNAQ